MELYLKVVLLLGLVVFTTQDIRGKKGCDCSLCGGVNNKLNPIVGKKFGDEGNGKGCSLCERRKEMLRQEREKQAQLQKCPFEILGATNIKGKTSEEVFDQFRELIVPTQNGFFDMMRGVVKTMHVSSEAELKWAKEKEAKELAKKRAEEAKKQKEARKDDIVKMTQPKSGPDSSPKVTVVVKQTPCGQILPQNGLLQSKDITLFKRLPKEANTGTEEELQELQMLDPNEPQTIDYLVLDSNENILGEDLMVQLLDSGAWTTMVPSDEEQEAVTDATPVPHYENTEDTINYEFSTESPFVKFMTHGELKAQVEGRRSSGDDFNFGLNLLPTGVGTRGQEEGGDINHILNPIYNDK